MSLSLSRECGNLFAFRLKAGLDRVGFIETSASVAGALSLSEGARMVDFSSFWSYALYGIFFWYLLMLLKRWTHGRKTLPGTITPPLILYDST